MSKKFALILTVFLFLNYLSYSPAQSQNNRQVYFKNQIPLGVPKDSDPSDDYILAHPQYIVSYNHKYNSVNWAGWKLDDSYIGKTDRYSGKFITDTTLPPDFLRITHDDYTNSGYDRGHVVRSHDRSSNDEDNKSTFLMTNIFPQTPDLNRGVWLDFERFCEDLAEKENKEIYIYAGGIYKSNTFINGKIRIPDSCYKIAVVLERGEGLECVGYNTLIYAVIMPNIDGIRKRSWTEYAVCVSKIEKSTGYNFLSSVPEKIQGIIEQIIYKPIQK